MTLQEQVHEAAASMGPRVQASGASCGRAAP